MNLNPNLPRYVRRFDLRFLDANSQNDPMYYAPYDSPEWWEPWLDAYLFGPFCRLGFVLYAISWLIAWLG